MINDIPRTFVGTTTFRVDGMTCDHCRHAVTTEICAVPGVESVAVDLTSGTVTVATVTALSSSHWPATNRAYEPTSSSRVRIRAYP